MISLNSIHGGKIELKALRVILGLRGHRPSAFNIKVGKCMRKGGYSPSDGGRYDTTFQDHFVSCCISAGANVQRGGRTTKRRAAAAE
jgi:hypothetical protein